MYPLEIELAHAVAEGAGDRPASPSRTTPCGTAGTTLPVAARPWRPGRRPPH